MHLSKTIALTAVIGSIAGCATTHEGSPQPLAECAAGASGSIQTVETTKGSLSYRACAGTLPIADENGKIADLFFTAYLVEPTGSGRPVAFIWNGGPGADSGLLHFHALGPKLIKGDSAVDNAVTPLGEADLVFLDPAGTGFSRAASDEAEKTLYSTTGDIMATRRFIGDFLREYKREGAPIFLVGESFGTWRAAGTAEVLIDAGMSVAGIALISGGIPLGEDRDRALGRALSLQNRTATALALGKLAPELQSAPDKTIVDAADFAREKWYPALSKPALLSVTERAAVIEGLARYMGISPAVIDPATLWVSPRQFREQLLAESGVVLDVFDMRKPAGKTGHGNDAAIVRYYRDTLGYLGSAYAGVEADAIEVGGNWRYDQAPITEESLARAMAGEGPPSPSQPWTLRAAEKNTDMRFFVATGLYDSLNSCLGNAATIASLPSDIGVRFRARCYRGGHMMYDMPDVEVQFGKDLSEFIVDAKGKVGSDN